jgi:hypothetical protein
MGSFNKGEHSRKGGRGSFCSKMFYNCYKNLIKSPKKSFTSPPRHFDGRREDVADQGLLVGDVLHLHPDLAVLGDEARKKTGLFGRHFRFLKAEIDVKIGAVCFNRMALHLTIFSPNAVQHNNNTQNNRQKNGG